MAPVVLWDERYSSRDARSTLVAHGVRKGKGAMVNKLAAEIILQVRARCALGRQPNAVASLWAMLGCQGAFLTLVLHRRGSWMLCMM